MLKIQTDGYALHTSNRLPSLIASAKDSDPLLAIGSRLISAARVGHDASLRLWLLGNEDHLQEKLRSLSAYSYGTEGGVGNDTPNSWGLQLDVLRAGLFLGMIVAGISGGVLFAGWFNPFAVSMFVVAGVSISIASALGIRDWLAWRSIPKEVVERRIQEPLLKVAFSISEPIQLPLLAGEVPNGEYIVQVRGMDRAGNDSAISSISLTVDNAPPAVSITERWWIWENGTLKVSPNHFPIASIQVTIQDSQKRWMEVTLGIDPGRNSYLVKWDRRFGDGTLAPSGEYPVLAVACDVNGLCGQDEGRIVVPEVATSTATLTPSQTATITLTPSITSVATQILPTPTLVLETPIPEEIPETTQTSLPLWRIIGLLGLFLVIASASLVDPRPKALKQLGETFRMMTQTKDDSNNNN
jgi:hypothetical protein